MLTGCARTEGYYKQTNKDNTWLSNPQDTEKTESAEAVRVSTKKFYRLMGRIVQRDFSFMRTKVTVHVLYEIPKLVLIFQQ